MSTIAYILVAFHLFNALGCWVLTTRYQQPWAGIVVGWVLISCFIATAGILWLVAPTL